jgi:F0F1-type ATP synthase membrane subunit b/b'
MVGASVKRPAGYCRRHSLNVGIRARLTPKIATACEQPRRRHCGLRGIRLADSSAQAQPDREQYQAALSEAQRARQGLCSQDRVEAPRDFRARVSQYQRWWLMAVAGLSAITSIGLVFSVYDKRISAWLEKQDRLSKETAEACSQARMQAEAEQAEREQTREIANREMDRLAAERRRQGLA